ncbi:MAG: RsmE family RNA methyltransferase [Gemmatimonadota bacterium]
MVGVDRSGVAAGRPNFVTGEQLVAGTTCVLDEAAARHMRVLRLDPGASVGIRDGHGLVAEGRLGRLSKTQAHIDVDVVETIAPLPAVHLLVPVADRDRMLWLAEKACELGCTSWRPVLWQRSRSVSPRGEGIVFQAKTRARMEGALAQSEGAWLPQIFPEASPDRAALAAPPGDRIVLDPAGAPLVGHHAASTNAPVTVALGPEGGFEQAEIDMLIAAGFRTASIGRTILRFETAGVAALAILRTVLAGPADHHPGGPDE